MSQVQPDLGQGPSSDAAWQDEVRRELLVLFQDLAPADFAEADQAPEGGLNSAQRAKALCEQITALQAGQMQNQAKSQEQQQFFELALIDMVSLRLTEIDADLENDKDLEESVKEDKKVLIDVVKQLFSDGLLTFGQLVNHLQDRPDPSRPQTHILEPFLQECGILGTQLTLEQISKKVGQSGDLPNGKTLVRVPGLEWQKEYIKKLTTKIQYEQEKFNLQREENEGYAKLVVQLNQPNLLSWEKEKVLQLSQNVNELIGYFNLDPNRILDLILESFENNIKELIFVRHQGRELIYYLPDLDKTVEIYMALIDSTSFSLNPQNKGNNSKKIATLLGFKIQNTLQELNLEEIDTRAEPKEIIPYPLLVLTALLIKNNVITPENIWPYLTKRTRSIDIAGPHSSGKQVSANQQAGRQEVKFIEEPDSIQAYHDSIQALLNQKYQGLATNVLDQDEKARENERYEEEMMKLSLMKREKFPYNYQLWLVACLIAVNDFEDAELVIGSAWGDETNLQCDKLDLTIHNELLCNLFTYTDIMIEQMYAPLSKRARAASQFTTIEGKNKGVSTCTSPEDLAENLPKVLRILGPHLGLNHSAFNRVLRVVNHYMVDRSNSEQIKAQAYRMTGAYFLPALCATKELKTQLDTELWQIMKKIDYKNRFQFYYQLRFQSYVTKTILLQKLVTLQPKVIRWTKSLSDEEDQIRKAANQLTDIANGGNGLILANQLLKVCSNFNNLTKSVIVTMQKGRFEELTLDMMAYSILNTLVEKQDQFKTIDSEGNVLHQFSYLTEFVSLFFKAFPQVDMKPILVYVLNRLKQGNNFHEAIFLSGILQTMFGQKDLQVNLLNEKQMQSLAGGMQLKLEMLRHTKQYQLTERSRNALEKVFYSKDEIKFNDQGSTKTVHLTIPFRIMVHLAQQTQYLLNDNQAEDLIYIQNVFDKVHLIFSQFVDTAYLLCNDRQQYKMLMPENKYLAQILSKEYRLPFQYSLTIIRRSFKQIHKQTQEELTEMAAVYRQTFDLEYQNKIDLYKEGDDLEWEEYPYWDEVRFLKEKQEKTMWNNFNEEIFAIFWQLELQDISQPSEIYDDLIKEKDTQIQNVQNGSDISYYNQSSSNQNGGQPQSDLRNESANAAQYASNRHNPNSRTQQMKDEIKRLEDTKRKLRNEQKQLLATKNDTKAYLKNNLKQYFEKIQDQQTSAIVPGVNDENGISLFLTQYCLYPRLMLSPTDALYSIEFLKILLEIQVPKINVLNILSQVMKGFNSFIHCCSNNESENLGIFFMEWFQMIETWTKNNGEVWRRDYSKYSGFAQKVGQPDQIVTFEHLEKIVEKIHTILFQFLKVCIENPKKQIMKTRCALKILQRIRSVFPRDRKIAVPIQEELKKIIDAKDEIQQDIWTLAFQYNQNLKGLIQGKMLTQNAGATNGGNANQPNNQNQKPSGNRESNPQQVSARRINDTSELANPSKAQISSNQQLEAEQRQGDGANPAGQASNRRTSFNQMPSSTSKAEVNKREAKQNQKAQQPQQNRRKESYDQYSRADHQRTGDQHRNPKDGAPAGDGSASSIKQYLSPPANQNPQMRRNSGSRSPKYQGRNTNDGGRRDSHSKSPFRQPNNYNSQSIQQQKGSQPRSGNDRNDNYDYKGGNKAKKGQNDHSQPTRGDNGGDGKDQRDWDNGRDSRVGDRKTSRDRIIISHQGSDSKRDYGFGQSTRQDNRDEPPNDYKTMPRAQPQNTSGGRPGGSGSQQQALLGKPRHPDVSGAQVDHHNSSYQQAKRRRPDDQGTSQMPSNQGHGWSNAYQGGGSGRGGGLSRR